MLNPEIKSKIHESIEGMSRDEVVDQVASCVHAPMEPEKVADYLISMKEEVPGNPY